MTGPGPFTAAAFARVPLAVGPIVLTLFSVLVLGVLFLPILVIAGSSFTASPYIAFPPRGWSLRWYGAVLGDRGWIEAAILSVKAAALSAAFAVVLGTVAALCLVRGRFAGRQAIHLLIMAPMIVPTIVMAVGVYFLFVELKLLGTIWPGSEELRCTTVSVAAHSLYERGDPCIQPGPGGINDLTDSVFRQEDHTTVAVSGSRFVPTPYKVKLEGAELVGYRSIVMVGIRDAAMIGQLRSLLDQAQARARDRFSKWVAGKDYTIEFHVYGKNAVMGALEPMSDATPHEVGLLINVVAKEQELANGVAMYVRGTLQHISYPGIVNTAGNLAYPFSPFNVPVGPAYRFSVYHLLPLADPCEIFPIEMMEVRN
jgi:Acyclic terpene utilisation family protein AtuA